MRNILIIFLTLFILAPVLAAGQDIGQPVSAQASENWRKTQEAERVNAQNTRKADEFRRQGVINTFPVSSVVTYYQDSPELTGKAKEYLRPGAAFRDQYKSFLQLPGTGMVTLLSDRNYFKAYSKPKAGLNKLIEKCPYLFIPGYGSFFSFRQNDYVNYPLADIGFKGNLMFSLGTLTQGIFVNVGDADIAKISPDSKGLDYLFSFTPATTLKGAAQESGRFEKGVRVGDFIYKKTADLEINKTYGLRVVAYRAHPMTQPDENSKENNPYSLVVPEEKKEINPLEKDKREDIIVVFRVVEKHDDGTLVLLWRELKTGESPEIVY